MSKGSNPAFAMWEKRASANDNLPDVVRLSGFGKKTGVTNVRRSETKEAMEEKRPSTNNDKLPPDELPDIDIDIDIAKLSVDTKAEGTSPKLRKAETLEKAMGFSPKAAKTPQQSPKKRVVNASLADRMKAFNGPLNQTSENNSSKAYLAENAKKMRGEQSKKRHEMRKKNVGKVAPIKQSNVTAARVNLDEFVPPVYEKSDTDCNQIAEALQNNFVFENLNKSDEKVLIKAFEKMQVHEGQQIIKQGDQGDYFYVIGEGKVRFEVKGKVVGTAEAGKSFGELSLLYTSPRSASVIAESNPTVLFRVDQNAFRYVMETKAKEKDGEKMSLLKGINFLKDFNPSDLHRLCDCMTPRHFEKDEVVVTKGADGEAFYILKKGMMVVKDISVGGTAYEDVTLAPGDYFGERALLTSEPRAANVVGMEDGVCFLIDRFTFEKVLGNFSQVIMRSQDKVKLEGVKAIKEAKLAQEIMEKLADAVVDVEFESGNNIQEKGKHSEAALYLIREGTVSIMGTDIYAGGYFGDEQLLADAKGTADRAGYIVPDLTVKCATNIVCGMLSLKECRLLFDTTKIDIGDKKEEDYNFRSSNILKRRSTIRESFKTNSITMKDLKRQDMLGEGAFGEVWLVKADVWGLGEEEYMEEFALKVQNLDNPDHDNMADIVKREMDVISSLEHPFIVDMVTSQEVENESLMLMSVVRGGELWGVLHKEQDDGSWLSGIAEPDAKFYALIIADTIAYMHQKNIIFRDLKPENVLIDKDGYPNIIDFGFAKFCKDKTYTFCGTPNYVAPEIILSTGHGVGVDHWALGIMIYEMVAGENPFYYDGVDNGTLFEIIVKEEPFPSEKASESLQSLLNGLLEKDPTQRLGNLAGNERDILRHKWFEELDLELLRNKMVDAPWIPPIERND